MKSFRLKGESLLSKIPVQLNVRQAFLIDGIRISLEMIEEELDVLEQKLLIFSTQEAKPKISSLFTSVWNIVDSTARLKRLLEAIGIFPVELAMQAFFDEILLIRHTFQHLDERIDELFTNKGNSLLGQLSWVYFASDDDVKMFLVKSGIDHKNNAQGVLLFSLLDCNVGINWLRLTAYKRTGKKAFDTTEIHFDSFIENMNILVESIEEKLQKNRADIGAVPGFIDSTHWVGLVNQVNCSKSANGAPNMHQVIAYDDFKLIYFEES